MQSALSQPVLICGAGPSGLALAIELERRGIGFQIIDKAKGPAPIRESRALAFNLRSQDIMRESGVTPEIEAAGHVLYMAHFQWEGKQTATLEIHEPGNPDRRMISIPQGRIERIMMKVLEKKGITPFWNTELAGFEESANKIAASLKDRQGKTKKLEFDYIAGCDGAHSIVRKQGGYSFEGESDPQIWSLADIKTSDTENAHRLVANLNPQGANASIPIAPDIVRLIHTGKGVLKHHPGMKYAQSVLWESEFRVSYRMVKRFARGRSFLCGDAAHIHSPVGGRGMNLGIEDAATLAYLFSIGREGEYATMRLPVAKKVLSLTHAQTRALLNNSSLANFAKHHVLPKLLLVPFVKNNLLKGITGLDTPTPEWLVNAKAIK